MPVESSTTIVLSLSQVVTLATTLGGALVTAYWVLLRALLSQFQAAIDKRFEELAEQGDAYRELERNFLNLRLELPEKYVRREDYIRGQTVIEAKLDAISSEVRIVQIQQGGTRES